MDLIVKKTEVIYEMILFCLLSTRSVCQFDK